MILVTGGLGFIGSHTASALLDLGESCLVTQHQSTDIPRFLEGYPSARLSFAPLDVTDRAAVLRVPEQYPNHTLTGIVHFAGALSTDPFDDMRKATCALANILEAASVWQVGRVSIASAIGVYGLVNGPEALSEGAHVPLDGNAHVIVAQKKSAEVYAELMARQYGLPCTVLRIGAVYGPRYRSMRSFVSRLMHAAARRTALDLAGVQWGVRPGDGGDWCYVKDCARGIALLQTGPQLNHRVYNVGSGTVTRNRDFVSVVQQSMPDVHLDLMDDAGEPPMAAPLDITRIRTDVGYEPRFTAEDAIRDYVEWLRSGNGY